MGEHPSPGPAVAACAEAERIEELEPEADERLPAAPEDVSAPSLARANFLGDTRRRAAPDSSPWGQLGGFKVTRERPGLAGSLRTGGGGGAVSPKARAPPPLGLPRLPCRTQPRRCAGDPSATGAPSPRLVQCPGHGVFPQRRPRHSSGSPPLPLATCGFSEPREGAGAAESPEPQLAGLTTPFFAVRLALAGHLRVATLIKIQAGPCP